MGTGEIVDEIGAIMQQQNLDRAECRYVRDLLLKRRTVANYFEFKSKFANLHDPERLYDLVCEFSVEYTLSNYNERRLMADVVHQALGNWTQGAE